MAGILAGLDGGLGFGFSPFSLKIGGGIDLGSKRPGGCKSHDPSKKWVICPNDQVVEAAKFAVAEFNKKYGNNLVFQVVLEAWVFTNPCGKKEYSIELVVIDGCLNRVLKFHAVVTETPCAARKRTLVSFDQIVD
ncbi:uncharacterized protein LOC105436097 [Cucumis sativus]|uniref:Phloem filament protein n=1 Tax=Cucumis sativus TaxID=3659 RepID=A0A0A0K660_CUCSA|nr:uncharacterized protein LOC105436097 [Cucumis sativus]KGN43782.1 hypothetical protein Csa_017370 [Cucumis sativus]